MAKKIKLVALNDLQPFEKGGKLKRKGLPKGIGPGKIPGSPFPPKGKTLSRKTSEIPVGTKKVNAFNFKKGRPFNRFERLKRKFLQEGGLAVPQDTTDPARFAPQRVDPEGFAKPFDEFRDAQLMTDLLGVADHDNSEYDQFMQDNYVPYSNHPEAKNINGRPVENPPIDARTRKPQFQDGGVIFKPSDVRENLPQLSNEQLAELSTQMFKGQREGVVSDTIQYNIPEFDPTLAGSQQRVPIEFTTPSLNFETEGIPTGVPADRRQAPVLGGRRKGGRMKKGCGGKLRMK